MEGSYFSQKQKIPDRNVTFSKDFPCRCQELRYLNVSQCRVSEAGVASFLCYHPLLADLLFEDTVGALAIINTTDCPLLSLNMISCVATTGGPADTDNKVCFGFCYFINLSVSL